MIAFALYLWISWKATFAGLIMGLVIGVLVGRLS